MTVASMALPVDIPWERYCVSNDMMDRRACDSDRPAKWQSSIAVFKYVPDDDYQVYPDRLITYLKVVCTCTGYQAKADEIQGIITAVSGLTVTDLSSEIEQATAQALPCTEALVQITVAPPDNAKLPLDRYPYFMDFQPKKREMLETATDTNEFMSRSLEDLNINKSAGSTQSQEVLDIDQGYSVSGSGQGSYAGTGGGASFSYSQQGQWGTKQMGGNQSGLTRATDESHERRETVSHTAQITQLWHLLDSYHVGTNRALFFIQPRPHVLQAPSGFVGDAPRSIEGIQEFFLIVNQPKGTPPFCIGVRLDTGHLSETHVMDFDYRTDTPPPLPLLNPTPLLEDTDLVDDGSERNSLRHDNISLPFVGTVATYDATVRYNCKKRTRSVSDTYIPTAVNGENYLIDVNNLAKNPNNIGNGTLAGYAILPGATQSTGDVTTSVVPAPDGSSLTMQISGTSRACFKAGSNQIQENVTISPTGVGIGVVAGLLGVPVDAVLSTLAAGEEIETLSAYGSAAAVIDQQVASGTLGVEVFLVSQDPIRDTGEIQKQFIVTTRTLCCCQEGNGEREPEGIVYESDVIMGTPGKQLTVETENQLRSTMRREMLRSIVSSRRTSPRSIADSRLALDLLAPILMKDRYARRALGQAGSGAIPPEVGRQMKPAFREALKHISRYKLLRMPVPALVAASGLEEKSIYGLRTHLISASLNAPGRVRGASEHQGPAGGAAKRPAAAKGKKKR